MKSIVLFLAFFCAFQITSGWVVHTFYNDANCSVGPNYYIAYSVARPGVCAPGPSGYYRTDDFGNSTVAFFVCDDKDCSVNCYQLDTSIKDKKCTVDQENLGSYTWDGSYDSALPDPTVNGGQIFEYNFGCDKLLPYWGYQLTAPTCYPDLDFVTLNLANTSAIYNQTGVYHYKGQSCVASEFTSVDPYLLYTCDTARALVYGWGGNFTKPIYDVSRFKAGSSSQLFPGFIVALTILLVLVF